MSGVGPQPKTALIGAAVAAVAAALVLAVAPLYESGKTLIAANGAAIAWVIVVPLLVALLPWAVSDPRRRHTATVAAAVVLLLMCFVSSAGVFFLPAALLLAIAAYSGRLRSGS